MSAHESDFAGLSDEFFDDLTKQVQDVEIQFELVRAQRDHLLAGLVAAVECVRVWHGMGMSKEIEPDMWRLYWEGSPEMKPIRQMLEKYAKAEVASPASRT